jgi:hypothetical protein
MVRFTSLLTMALPVLADMTRHPYLQSGGRHCGAALLPDAADILPTQCPKFCVLLLSDAYRYGAVIFACEVVGVTAVLPYCLMLLTFYTTSGVVCTHVLLSDAYRYGAVIFACEVVGVTAVLPYCLMLLRRCTYVGSGGLPPDDGRWKLPKDKRFTVRVLVPCYKVCACTLLQGECLYPATRCVLVPCYKVCACTLLQGVCWYPATR